MCIIISATDNWHTETSFQNLRATLIYWRPHPPRSRSFIFYNIFYESYFFSAGKRATRTRLTRQGPCCVLSGLVDFWITYNIGTRSHTRKSCKRELQIEINTKHTTPEHCDDDDARRYRILYMIIIHTYSYIYNTVCIPCICNTSTRRTMKKK